MLTCNILKIAQSARSGFSTVISGKKNGWKDMRSYYRQITQLMKHKVKH